MVKTQQKRNTCYYFISEPLGFQYHFDNSRLNCQKTKSSKANVKYKGKIHWKSYFQIAGGLKLPRAQSTHTLWANKCPRQQDILAVRLKRATQGWQGGDVARRRGVRWGDLIGWPRAVWDIAMFLCLNRNLPDGNFTLLHALHLYTAVPC